MKVRLAVLAAGVALLAAAPVWAGTMKVDFTARNVAVGDDGMCLVNLKTSERAVWESASVNLSLKRRDWAKQGTKFNRGDQDRDIRYACEHFGLQSHDHDDWTTGEHSGWAKSDSDCGEFAFTAPEGDHEKSLTGSPASTTVPEPSSLSLFVLALGGFGVIVWRRYRTA